MPYGQWTLTPPRDSADLHPPLLSDSPLMLSLDQLLNRGTQAPWGQARAAKKSSPATDPFSGKDEAAPSEEDKWLSQVEIVTHVGPHRRLWMGPQFCFKTFRTASAAASATASKAKDWYALLSKEHCWRLTLEIECLTCRI